jgi:hypothetical protein
MTEDDAKKRIAQIEAMQAGFDNKLASLDKDLLSELLANADTVLANPKTLSRILGTFDDTYHIPVLQQFGADLLTIKTLNDAYFEGAIGETMGGQLVNQALFENVQRSVERVMLDQFGIQTDGEIISNGLFDLFSKDTTVRREIQQFAYGQKASGIGLEKFKKNLRRFIEGTPTNPDTPTKGVWKRHYDTVAYDTYQQADRIAQQTFADGLNMSAFLYLGGTIAGTRLFCRVRDGKVFLRSEIDKMGTPADAYGGYTNKATGAFAGKPTGGVYSAMLSAGGYSCRHHWSALSDREAMRRRPDLAKDKKGRLQVVELSTDRIEPPIVDPNRKPTKPVNRFPDGFTPAKTTAEAQQFAIDQKLANNVNYEGLHVEVANQVNATLLQAKAKYRIKPSHIEASAFSGNYPMQTRVTSYGGYALQINTKTLGSGAKLANALASFEQAERDLVWLDGSLAGVVTHEVGHMLHYEHLSSNQNTLGNFIDVLSDLRRQKPKFEVGSRYGMTRQTEAVAELYSKVERDGIDSLDKKQRAFLNKQLGWKK